MVKFSIIEIKWRDACSHYGWRSIDNHRANKLSVCQTVGYLLKKDSKSITLAQSIDDSGSTTESIVIPKAGIVKMKTLKTGEYNG